VNVALVQLVNNSYVICDLELLEEEPCYYMKNAYEIKEDPLLGFNGVQLVKYPKYTEDEGCLMHTEKIITMVDPSPKIVESYMKVIGE
jgi:hypothetical protein